MKMTIGAELPEGYQPAHNDLAAAANILIAHSLLPMFEGAMTDELAKANVAGIVTELAYVFDEGEIEIGGRTYRPRIAFVNDAGLTLPGVADLDNLSDMADDPFTLDPEAKVSFEAEEFAEE